jgi:hypothetical protein
MRELHRAGARLNNKTSPSRRFTTATRDPEDIPMSERTWYETIKVEGGQLLDKVAQIIREGNVRRIVIKQGDRSIAEFPLTVGVVGVVFAPILAAVGALAAITTDCSIIVERTAPATNATASEPSQPADSQPEAAAAEPTDPPSSDAPPLA